MTYNEQLMTEALHGNKSSLEELKSNAGAGNAEAQYYLAKYYENANGPHDQDYHYWLEKSKNNGYLTDDDIPSSANNSEQVNKAVSNFANNSSEDVEQIAPNSSNLFYAIIVGLVSCILFALFWALFTYLIQVKWIFLGILAGAVVGTSIRQVCKNPTNQISIIAGIFGLLSCIIGDFFTSVAFIAQNEGLNFLDTLSYINYSYLFEIAFADFDAFSLLVYFLATISSYAVCKGQK